jgi:mono/diheme cytochrome c family protein
MEFLRHALITLILLVAVPIAAAAFLVFTGRIDVAADREHSRAVAWLLETARERAVANQAGRVKVRLPDLTDEERLHGAVVGFEEMCARCHAPPHGGTSALARGLNPPPPDLTRAAVIRGADELFWVTRHGIRMTGMPAWGPTHVDDELWPVIALITRFPEFAEGDYATLLAAAREAGAEHVHDHEPDHGHNHDRDHDHSH